VKVLVPTGRPFQVKVTEQSCAAPTVAVFTAIVRSAPELEERTAVEAPGVPAPAVPSVFATATRQPALPETTIAFAESSLPYAFARIALA